ncbi:hypothetical protein I230019B6_13610 [Firmicutes bacterium i23-0019-B6]
MGKTSKQKKTKADKFIMLPTVDFCFKELMQDKKVRKGLIAAFKLIWKCRLNRMISGLIVRFIM